MTKHVSELEYVGSLIQKIRQKKGLSQGDLCKLLKDKVRLDRSNLSKIERNQRHVSKRMLKVILNSLGYHPVITLTPYHEQTKA